MLQVPVHVQSVYESQSAGGQQVLQHRKLAAAEVHDHFHVVHVPHVRRQPGGQVQRLREFRSRS